MTTNVTTTYWGHRHQWRVRCFQPAERLCDMPKILEECFCNTKCCADKIARRMANTHNANLVEW